MPPKFAEEPMHANRPKQSLSTFSINFCLPFTSRRSQIASLSARIGNDVNPSISGSFARYLAAAGKFSFVPISAGRSIGTPVAANRVEQTSSGTPHTGSSSALTVIGVLAGQWPVNCDHQSFNGSRSGPERH